MDIQAQILFIDFQNLIQDGLSLKHIDERRYAEVVQKQARDFAEEYTKSNNLKKMPWDKWLPGFDEKSVPDFFYDVTHHTVGNLGNENSAIKWAYAFHYRLHGEIESLEKFAFKVDKFVFDESLAARGKIVFARIDQNKFSASFAEKNILKETYQYGRDEFVQTKKFFLGEDGLSRPKTAAIVGAGGYGKSSLAQEIADDLDIRAAFPGGIYWLQFGLKDNSDEKAGSISLDIAITEMLRDQYNITKQTGLDLVGRDQDISALLDALPKTKILLIADDLWNESQARWLDKIVGNNASVLLTTRRKSVADRLEKTFVIERLTDDVAFDLLTHGMDNLSLDQTQKLRVISKKFKGWPLIIDLANGVFKQRYEFEEDGIELAISTYDNFLSSDEIDGWDVTEAGDQAIEKRRKLVGLCIEAGLDAIDASNHPELLRDLGVFPDDTEIPFYVIIDLWKHHNRISVSRQKAETLLWHFNDFSFFSSFRNTGNLKTSTLRLHDEILLYFRLQNGSKFTECHRRLLLSIKKHCSGEDWGSLDATHRYGWTNALHHLEQAGLEEQAENLRTNFKWLKGKLYAVGVSELQNSFSSNRPLSMEAKMLYRAVNRSGPILGSRPSVLAHHIYGRLGHYSYGRLGDIVAVAEADVHFWPIPLRPHLDPPGHRILTLTHDGYVSRATFNLHGNRIMTSSFDGTICVWNAETGERINSKQIKVGGLICSSAFNSAGTRILTASADTTVCIWNADSGERVSIQSLKHDGFVYRAVFDRDGSRVLTVSSNGTFCVWNTETAERVNLEPTKVSSLVSYAAFNHDGTRVVTVSDDRTVRVWSAETGEKINVNPTRHDSITDAAFSHDGSRIVTVSSDGMICIWCAESGNRLNSKPIKYDSWIRHVALSYDGTRVVTASEDRAVCVWNADSGDRVNTEIMKHNGRIHSVHFNHDGTRVVTASDDNTACVWDANTGRSVNIEPIKHGDTVYSAEFSPDGTRVVTASEDTTACVWDVETGLGGITESVKHDGGILSVAFSLDDSQIVTVSDDATIGVWNAKSGDRVNIKPMKCDSLTHSVRLNHDGSRLVAVAHDGTVYFWNVHTAEKINATPIKYGFNTVWAALSSDGTRIVTTSRDGTVNIWNVMATDKINIQPIADDCRIYTAQFNHDGTQVITISYDNTVCVWEAETGQRINFERMKHGSLVKSAVFSRDGSRVATASSDGTVSAWDAHTGERINIKQMKQSEMLRGCTFSHDGTRIVTSSHDGTVCVWDTVTGERINTEAIKHYGDVYSAIFSQDDSRIITASDDGSLGVWDPATGEPQGQVDFDSVPISIHCCHERLVVGLRSGNVFVFQL